MGSCKNFFVRMNFNSHHRLKLIYQSLAGIRTGARKGEKILGEGCNTFFTKLARVWGLPENSTFSVLGKSLQNCSLLRCVPTKKIKMLSSLVSLRWRTTPSRRHQWRSHLSLLDLVVFLVVLLLGLLLLRLLLLLLDDDLGHSGRHQPRRQVAEAEQADDAA